MKILIIAAHPDDAEIGAGGLMARYSSKHDIKVLLLTAGENGGEHDKRLAEQSAACMVTGIKKIGCEYMRDGMLTDNYDLVKRIRNCIDNIAPAVVITHFPHDTHQDHRNTAKAVKSALNRNTALLYMRSWSSEGFNPNLFINTSGTATKKVAALNCFDSQVAKYETRGINFVDEVMAYDRLCGMKIGTAYAEGFYIEKYIVGKEDETWML